MSTEERLAPDDTEPEGSPDLFEDVPENAAASSPWTEGMHTEEEAPEDTGDKDGENSSDSNVIPTALKNLELNGACFTPVS